MRVSARAEGIELYYENQKKTADEVIEYIKDTSFVFQMVLAVCQAGKTGCMLAIIESLVRSGIVEPDNIFIITGLSDKEWEVQTRDRVPLGTNVIHRGQLNNSKCMFDNLKNAVILVDECQLACKEDMTIDKILVGMGLKDLEYLKTNNINIVEFSATPNGTLSDMECWKECSVKHVMIPGDGYTGHKQLLEQKRVFQAHDLYIDDDPKEGWSPEQKSARKKKLKPAMGAIEFVNGMIKFAYEDDDARYHIFRIPSGDKGTTVIKRIKDVFGDANYNFVSCFTANHDNDTTKILISELNKVPLRHTIIFIKESARCATTFPCKERIGLLYERMPQVINDDTIVQALVGRACGYGVDRGTIVFTHIPSVTKYIDMVESDFENRDNFSYFGKTSKRRTYIYPGGYIGVDDTDASAVDTSVPSDIAFHECKSFAEAKSFWYTDIRTRLPLEKQNAKGLGPRKRKESDDMFFRSAWNSKTCIRTKAMLEKELGGGG